eukprot:gene29408-35497_t
MASIDDLLLADDSGDDENLGIDTEDIDLEQLLNSKEDDDDHDNFEHLKSIKSIIAKAPKPNVEEIKAESSSSSSTGDAKLDEIMSMLRSGRNDSTNSDADPELLKALEQEDDEEQHTTHLTAEGEPVSLKQAEQREYRSLIHTDKPAPSALQLRRQANQTTASLLHLEDMSMISSQLKRNVSFETHGPGTGSAYCVCPKFIGIGTMKGFIILFDHKQEIRRVLNTSQSASLKSCHITSLACVSDGSMIASGYKQGEVLVWDSTKGIILKQVHDSSNADITRLFFLPSVSVQDSKFNTSLSDSDTFHLLVCTHTHILSRYKITKSLLSAWYVETECLLDDPNTPILDLSFLPSFNPAAAGGTVGSGMGGSMCYDLKQHHQVLQYFAFALEGMSVVVQTMPEVKILYKWACTPSAPVSSPSMSASPRQLIEWDWLYLPVPHYQPGMDDEGVLHVHTPTLTRCVGCRIQMLSMYIKPFAKQQVRSLRSSIFMRLQGLGEESGGDEGGYIFSVEYEVDISTHVTCPGSVD